MHARKESLIQVRHCADVPPGSGLGGVGVAGGKSAPPPRLAPELRPEGVGPESGRGHCRIVDLGLGRKDSSVGGLLA